MWLEKPHSGLDINLPESRGGGGRGKRQNVDLDIVLNILTSSCHSNESESRSEVHLIDPIY